MGCSAFPLTCHFKWYFSNWFWFRKNKWCHFHFGIGWVPCSFNKHFSKGLCAGNAFKGENGSFLCFLVWSTTSIFLLNVARSLFKFMDFLRYRKLPVLYEDGCTKHWPANPGVIPSRFYNILLQVSCSPWAISMRKGSSLLGNWHIKSSENSFCWNRVHYPSSHPNLNL